MSKTGTGWWLDTIGRVPLLTPAQEIELGSRVQQWLNHPDGPDDCPRNIKRSGERAKRQFVAANLRLAVSYVTKNCNRLITTNGNVQDDLIQAANLGVIRAVEKYDPSRGYRFSTYAYWWIRQSVNRWIDQCSRTISIPGSHSQMLSRVGMTRRRLYTVLLREPTTKEIADELGVTVEQLEALAYRSRTPLSLDQPGRDDESDLLSFVGHAGLDLEREDEWAASVERVHDYLQLLPPQQRRIVMALHGICYEEMTLGAVAKMERISPNRVQLIYKAALMGLRRIQQGNVPIRDSSSTQQAGVQMDLFDAA